MKFLSFFLFCFIFNVGAIAFSSEARTGIRFLGITESGVSISNFLCPSGMGNGIPCSTDEIDNAINFDMSGGRDLIFFNNFLYWLKEKSNREHFYKVNYPYLSQNDVNSKVDGEGYGAVGIFSITISSDPILVKFVDPSAPTSGNKVTLVAQLWYNGNDTVQLWSQDIVQMQQGDGFKISILNQSDDKLAVFLKNSQLKTESYASDMGKLLQPDNRNQKSYELCSKAPRTVRFVAD